MRRAATGVIHKNSTDRAAEVILSLYNYHFNNVEEGLDFDITYFSEVPNLIQRDDEAYTPAWRDDRSQRP